jgi:flavin reductase (DIM6/NTAB) family NADH-FMN oxidoreductase RutF
MYVDFKPLSANEVYFSMIQAVVPRPIAWVLSENSDGGHNLAPFSYFNAVCSDPPMIMLSIGVRPDGSPKDTTTNIATRRDFVVHIAHVALRESVNASSASLPAGESELAALDLPLAPFEGSRLPRLRDARIAMACSSHELFELGEAPQSVILGQVHGLYLDDSILVTDPKGRLRVDIRRLDPLARLGAGQYAALGEIFHLTRPM